MRIGLLVLMALSASPTLAQTAVTLDFSQPQLSASGVVIRAADGFTEYRSGVWNTEPVSSQAMADVQHPGGDAQAGLDACGHQALPRYIPGLGREVAVRRLTWWRAVAASECRYGLPAGLLDAVVLQESRYLPTAMSRAGALGLAQLMPATAAALGVADPLDPAANLDGGARYLQQMMARFSSVPLALAAYNAGPGAVRSSGGIPANSETPDYVRRVLGFWASSGSDSLTAVRRTAVILGFADAKE